MTFPYHSLDPNPPVDVAALNQVIIDLDDVWLFLSYYLFYLYINGTVS